MKRKLLTSLGALLLLCGAQAQTTVTVTATGTAGSYNTGSVNSSGTMNDGNMVTINSSSNVGWAMFDLSSLPTGIVVSSVSAVFTTYSSTSSSATNNLRGFVGTPSAMTGTALYSSCTGGPSFNASTWTANATLTKAFNASGISFIQSNVSANNVCVSYVRGSTNTYNIYGYPGGAGQQPQLVITYSVLPACSGAPNAGTVVATNTAICSPQAITFSLTGVTSASGLTYQWQSSPNGSTWSSIPSATTAITTQTVSSTSYYQCVVACGTNTAASTSVMVNYGAMPTAGTTVATNTVACVGQSIGFSLTGASSVTGTMYQWQSSPNGTTWTSIPSATAATTSQTLATGAYYQAIVTCGTNTVASTPIQVTMISPITYTTVPYLETFDNTWDSRCDNQNVPVFANWSSNPTTGNTSWRRQDAGSTANWTSNTTGIVTPIGAGSADFHSYYASSGTVGKMDLYVDMSSTQNYVMSFYTTNASGSDSLYVLLSTDGGATFSVKGGYGVNTSWTKETITLGAVNSASCVVRLSAISDYGADDIGVDSLQIFTASCITPPVAGTITGATNVSYGTTNTYTVSPATGNLQWYTSSSSTGPWIAVSSATDAVQAITAAQAGSQYLTVIASSVGCLNDTSNTPLMVNVNFPGDNVCGAIALSVGTSTAYYKPMGATVQPGEVTPPGTDCQGTMSWCNTTLDNSMWFSFMAPASGYVSVQSPGFDTQLALWKAPNCSGLLSASTATLLGANDDDPNYSAHGGVDYSSYVQAACLTPGAMYYIQLDSYSPAGSTDSTQIIITDMGTLDMSFTGLASTYCIPSTTSSSLTPAVSGGAFTINTGTTTISAFTPSVTGAGTYTVTYSLFGCTSNSMTTVNVSPTVTASSAGAPMCAGSSATLTASGATNYTWTPGAQMTASVVVTPTATTVYTVSGEMSGCVTNSTVNVTITPSTTVNISGPSLVCSGSTTTLTATGATNYTWAPGGETTPSIVVTPTANTMYMVTGDNCGSTMGMTTVSVTSSPVVNTTATSTMLCSGQSATLTASGSTSYTWMPGGATSAAIVVTPTMTTTYTVTGTSSCGTTTATIVENVSICTGIDNLSASGVNVYPNPNNGVLIVSLPTQYTGGSVIEMYDAIGKLVIRENLTSETTRINTQTLQQGVYMYKIYNNSGIVKIDRIVKQ